MNYDQQRLNGITRSHPLVRISAPHHVMTKNVKKGSCCCYDRLYSQQGECIGPKQAQLITIHSQDFKTKGVLVVCRTCSRLTRHNLQGKSVLLLSSQNQISNELISIPFVPQYLKLEKVGFHSHSQEKDKSITKYPITKSLNQSCDLQYSYSKLFLWELVFTFAAGNYLKFTPMNTHLKE